MPVTKCAYCGQHGTDMFCNHCGAPYDTIEAPGFDLDDGGFIDYTMKFGGSATDAPMRFGSSSDSAIEVMRYMNWNMS